MLFLLCSSMFPFGGNKYFLKYLEWDMALCLQFILTCFGKIYIGKKKNKMVKILVINLGKRCLLYYFFNFSKIGKLKGKCRVLGNIFKIGEIQKH